MKEQNHREPQEDRKVGWLQVTARCTNRLRQELEAGWYRSTWFLIRSKSQPCHESLSGRHPQLSFLGNERGKGEPTGAPYQAGASPRDTDS